MCDQQIKILSERPLPSEPNKPNHQDVDLSQLAIPNAAPSVKAQLQSKEAKAEETRNTLNIPEPKEYIAESNTTIQHPSAAF